VCWFVCPIPAGQRLDLQVKGLTCKAVYNIDVLWDIEGHYCCNKAAKF
jgi:hypothetical protein